MFFQSETVQQFVYTLGWPFTARALGEDQIRPKGQGLNQGAVLERKFNHFRPEFRILAVIEDGDILAFKGIAGIIEDDAGAAEVDESTLWAMLL